MLSEKSTSGNAVVVGAGVMGGGIAAQLANAGWRVKLLDVASNDAAARNLAAQNGLDRLAKGRPSLMFLPEYASRIEIGNTTDDLGCMADADWIVEAIIENLQAKQSLLAAVELHAGSNTVVTSNTSGLNLNEMSAKCGDQFRSRFFGSHFLNPPRYLKLLEVVPTPVTDSNVVAGFIRFAEQVLGHRVVSAGNSPGFISTRIWIEHLLESIRLAIEFGLTVEETDYLTGPLIGRPKSGTFRMADIVGLDIVCAIAANQHAALPDDLYCDKLVASDVLLSLASQGLLGEKAGAGFYKREGKTILSHDLKAGLYRERIEPDFPQMAAIAKSPLAERLRTISADHSSLDGRYLNSLLDLLHEYVSYVGPMVAENVTGR